MPRWLKITGIGCGGLLGLLILVGACAAILGGPTDAPTEPAEQQEQPTPDPTQQPEPASEPTQEPEPTPDQEEANSTVVVRVEGDQGLPFSGSYGNLDTQRSVDGAVPAEYEVDVDTGFMSMDSVTATMQKNQQGPGELLVEIVVDGETVKESNTTAEFGVVTVNWTASEQ